MFILVIPVILIHLFILIILFILAPGLEETRGLARKHCSLAVKALGGFEESDYKEALEGLCDRVLNRLK